MNGSNVVHLHDEPQPSISIFDPFYPSTWEGTTPEKIDWFVDGCIPRGAVTLLAGAGELGKSYLLQQLMVAAALGVDWLGRKTTRCRSFALFSEDGKIPLRVRQDAILKHYGASHADMEVDISWIDADADAARDPRLMVPNQYGRNMHQTMLWQQIRSHVLEEGVQMVFIDTAATTFGGKDERGQVTEYIRMLTALAREMNGAVILTLHPPKSGPIVGEAGSWYGGSGAWVNSVRSGMSLERPREYNEETGEHVDERILRVRKGNWTGNKMAIGLRWSDGVFVPEDLPPRKTSLTAQEKHDLDYRLLAGLRRFLANGTLVPADPDNPKSLPRRAKRSTPEFREWPLLWLADAQERLIAIGQVVRIEVGGIVCIRPADIVIRGEKPWQAI